MSEKKESEKRRPTRPSLKVSIPIAIYLKAQEKRRQADLLKKQRLMLNKMKEDHKREAIARSQNKDNSNDKQNNDKVNDKEQIPVPENPPQPNVIVPYPPRALPVHHPPRPQRPKCPRRLPHVGHGPRPQGPPRRQRCDFNNNDPMEPQHAMMPGGNQPAPPVIYNGPQYPIFGPRFN